MFTIAKGKSMFIEFCNVIINIRSIHFISFGPGINNCDIHIFLTNDKVFVETFSSKEDRNFRFATLKEELFSL